MQDIPSVPELTPALTNKRRAVKDASHVLSICETAFEKAKDEIDAAAEIKSQVSTRRPPYNEAELADEGKLDISNINTGFLEDITSKVAPRIVNFIDGAKYLISAEMPPFSPNGEVILDAINKTNTMRDIFTRTVRQWRAFPAFIRQLASLNSVYGYTFPYFPDDEWKPQIKRLDEAQVPLNLRLTDDRIPWFVVRGDMTPEELFEKIVDREAAEDAGWDIDNVIKAINGAMPAAPQVEGEVNRMRYEDLEEQLATSLAPSSDYNKIEYYLLFVKEYDGKTSQYLINKGESGEEAMLLKREDMDMPLEDIVVPFTFDVSDTLKGSQGIGRKIYDLAINIEKARNRVFDNFHDRGKFVIHAEDRTAANKTSVMIYDKFITIAGGSPPTGNLAVPSMAESYVDFDRFITSLVEKKVGAYIPPPLVAGASRTATESQISAEREDEQRRGNLEWFLTRFGELMGVMARRLFAEFASDPAAIAAQQQAKQRGVPREEQILWASQPSHSSILNLTDSESQLAGQWAASKINDPNYDQDFVRRLEAHAIVGEGIASRAIVPGLAPTTSLEAQRQQIHELTDMSQGIDIPVSPRDNHAEHMNVLRGAPDEMNNFTQGPIYGLISEGNVEGAMLVLQHYQQHYTYAEEQKSLGEQVNMERAFIAQVTRDIQKVLDEQQNQPEPI